MGQTHHRHAGAGEGAPTRGREVGKLSRRSARGQAVSILLLELGCWFGLLVGFVLLVPLFFLWCVHVFLGACVDVEVRVQPWSFLRNHPPCFRRLGLHRDLRLTQITFFHLLVCMALDKSLSVFAPPFPCLALVVRTLKEWISNYIEDLVGWMAVWSLI